MAATSDSEAAAAKQYVDYDEYVDFQIEKARAHIKATDIFTTMTTLVAAFVGYLLLFVVCDQWVLETGFSDWARSTLLAIVLLAMGAIFVRRVILPVVRRVHPLYAARMIERSDPKLQSNLLNFVDMQNSEGSAPAAPGVMRAMQKRAAVELSHIDVDEAIDRRPLLRVAYALLGVVVVSALYIVFSPKDPFTSVRRALLPTASIAVATETTIVEVTPGDDHVPARTHLTVEADVRGRDADRVQILFTTSDHKEVDQPVEMRRIDPDLPRFRGVLNGENGRGLLQSLSYTIVAGDARTRDFHIEVIQPPSARIDDVHLAFPSYMQFDERTTPGGSIDGWEGATVTVRATANMPVKSATLVMTDNEDAHAKGEEVTMQVTDGTKLSAKWKLEFRTDGTCAHYYYVQVRTAKNETDPEPTVHPLRIRPDQRPDVALVSPVGDLTGEKARPANAIIPLLIQAADPDFLLRSIRLKAERNGEEIVNEPLFENRDLGQSFRGTHDWNLGALKPAPRPKESIQFWIEARDNKQPTANRAVTPRVNLEILAEKSAEEVRKDLAAEKQEQADQLARAEETKNDGGTDPQPRNENDDAANEPQPERRPADVQPPGEKENPAKEEPSKNDRRQPDEKSESKGNENNKGQPQPPGNDPERALERLLQKQAAEEPPEPKEPPEHKEQQPPAESSKTERGENADKKNNGNAKKGAGKSADKEGPSKDPTSQDSGKKEGTDPASKPNTQPDPKAAKKPGDRSTEKPKKPGDEKSNPDKTGADDKGGSKDQSSGDDAKAGDENNKSADKNPSDKRSPENKAADKKDTENKTGGKKDAGKKDAEKKDTETRDAANKEGRKQDGTKGAGEKDTEEKKTEEKENGDAKSGDKPDKSTDPAKSDNGEPPKSEPKKTPKQDQPPGSDGAGDKENPSEGGDSDQGKPAKSKSKTDEERPGEATEPDNNPDSKAATRHKKTDSPDSEAEQEPADDSPNAKKRKATGKEKGEATGSEEDDPNAVKKKDLERKPDSKAGKMKPSENKDADAKRPGENRKKEAGNDSATDDAKETKRQPDGKKPTEDPGETDDPASKKPEKTPNDVRAKRPDNPPEAGNPEQKGEGRKKKQKSEQPQGGEKGESAASDQGESGANKEGAGDKGEQPGDSEKAGEKTGKSGDKPGKGSQSKPSDKGKESKAGEGGKPGEKGGKGEGTGEGEGEGEGEAKAEGKGQSGKTASEKSGKPGSSTSKSGGEPGGQSSAPVGGGVDGQPTEDGPQGGDGSSEGEGLGKSGTGGDSVPSAEEEQARLDYAKKASNLLLNRLKEQLSRGEIDQKLLDEMGWKDVADVTKFTRFLEENLKNTSDDAKRQQFEESLKNMRLGNDTISRKGGSGPERRVDNTAGRLVPVPPEYRQSYENYNKRIGAKRKTSDVKSTPLEKK